MSLHLLLLHLSVVTDASLCLFGWWWRSVVVSETRPVKEALDSPPFSSCELKERTIHTSLVGRRKAGRESAAATFGGGTVVVAESGRAGRVSAATHCIQWRA